MANKTRTTMDGKGHTLVRCYCGLDVPPGLSHYTPGHPGQAHFPGSGCPHGNPLASKCNVCIDATWKAVKAGERVKQLLTAAQAVVECAIRYTDGQRHDLGEPYFTVGDAELKALRTAVQAAR